MLPFWAGNHAQAAALSDRVVVVEQAAFHHYSADLAAVDSGTGVKVASDTCAQHQVCHNNCCVGCALCVLTLPDTQLLSFTSDSVLYSVVHRLIPGGSAHSLDRPPRG